MKKLLIFIYCLVSSILSVHSLDKNIHYEVLREAEEYYHVNSHKVSYFTCINGEFVNKEDIPKNPNKERYIVLKIPNSNKYCQPPEIGPSIYVYEYDYDGTLSKLYVYGFSY